MALGTDYPRQDCGIARSLELVGERWTLLILRDCFLGVRRFSDFQAHLDVSRAVLASRLDALVAEGLLERVGDGHACVRAHRGRDGPVAGPAARWPSGATSRTSPGPPGGPSTTSGAGRWGGTDGAPRCDIAPHPRDVETRPGPGADPTLRRRRRSPGPSACPTGCWSRCRRQGGVRTPERRAPSRRASRACPGCRRARRSSRTPPAARRGT